MFNIKQITYILKNDIILPNYLLHYYLITYLSTPLLPCYLLIYSTTTLLPTYLLHYYLVTYLSTQLLPYYLLIYITTTLLPTYLHYYYLITYLSTPLLPYYLLIYTTTTLLPTYLLHYYLVPTYLLHYYLVPTYLLHYYLITYLSTPLLPYYLLIYSTNQLQQLEIAKKVPPPAQTTFDPDATVVHLNCAPFWRKWIGVSCGRRLWFVKVIYAPFQRDQLLRYIKNTLKLIYFLIMLHCELYY